MRRLLSAIAVLAAMLMIGVSTAMNFLFMKSLAATEIEARKHPAAYPVIHVTSAEKGMGIAELRAAILADALI